MEDRCQFRSKAELQSLDGLVDRTQDLARVVLVTERAPSQDAAQRSHCRGGTAVVADHVPDHTSPGPRSGAGRRRTSPRPLVLCGSPGRSRPRHRRRPGGAGPLGDSLRWRSVGLAAITAVPTQCIPKQMAAEASTRPTASATAATPRRPSHFRRTAEVRPDHRAQRPAVPPAPRRARPPSPFAPTRGAPPSRRPPRLARPPRAG